MTATIQINGFSFVLHASGALFWEEEEMLIISDVHLGKISHFRKHGSAVPSGAVGGNFRKLTEVLQFFDASKICFLGDLFHSVINQEWRLFEQWVEFVPSEIILVEGNHDIISPLRYEDLGVRVQGELIMKEFLFTHHPEERPPYFNFAGHLHPGIQLHGLGRQFLKLPCFYRTQNQMILPAFGEFTGIHILTPAQGDEVYAITSEKVILIKQKPK